MIKDLWEGPRYTNDELMARLKFFIGVILGLTLFGIVFVVLYSLIFVTQPMNGMSPVDNKFFELIIPIATFLTGTLSGIMLAGDDKELRGKALDAANKPYTPPPPPPASSASYTIMPQSSGSGMSLAPTSFEPVASFVAAEVSGFGGKPAPAQPDHPEK
jgi:hypothetical protein